MTKFFKPKLFIFIIFLFVQLHSAKGQVYENNSTLHVYTQVKDTTQTGPFAKRDTLKTQPVYSDLYWYDIENNLKTRKESSQFEIYNFNAEKALIYEDMSDIFREYPLMFNYDLKESDRPAYIALLNSFPHQTSFFFNNIYMNDPIHGMFNSQYIPLNYVYGLETNISSGHTQNFGFSSASKINVTSQSLHTKAPWSQIAFKQGNFGYSSLDISFVQPVNPLMAVQLGGLHKLYDGTMRNSEHKGTNYRGEVTWQFKPNLYFRGQFFLSRDEAGLVPFNFTQKVLAPGHKELRDDFFFDLTWLPSDSSNERLHFSLYHNFISRKFEDRDSVAYNIRSKSKRYGLDVNYNLFLKKYELLIGTSAILPKTWGTAFAKTYNPYAIANYAKLKMPMLKYVTIVPSVQLSSYKYFDSQLSSSLDLIYKPSEKHELLISSARSKRVPNITERFFNFDSLFGNQNLGSEEHMLLYGSYRIRTNTFWQYQLDIGYNKIKNEIIWKEPLFINDTERDYVFITMNGSYPWWKLVFSAGGQYTSADLHITPRSSLWGRAYFHDVWLKGIVTIDAYGTVNYFDKHNQINFEPRLERFYLGEGITKAYFTLNYKIVATIKDVRISFEMDNALSDQVEVINGYTDLYQRWRIGLNWIFWD